MKRSELIAFLRRHRYAVQATRDVDGAPQAAVVGIAVSDQLEIVFDTLATSRKCQNLRRDPRIALVVGWDDDLPGRAGAPPLAGHHLRTGAAALGTLQRLQGRRRRRGGDRAPLRAR